MRALSAVVAVVIAGIICFGCSEPSNGTSAPGSPSAGTPSSTRDPAAKNGAGDARGPSGEAGDPSPSGAGTALATSNPGSSTTPSPDPANTAAPPKPSGKAADYKGMGDCDKGNCHSETKPRKA